MSSRKIKILSMVTAISILSVGCSKKEDVVLENPPKPVVVQSAQYKEYEDEITISGNVKPAQLVKPSFKVPGTIIDVYVKEGDKVSEGQPLMALSTEEIEIMISGAQAQYDTAQRELDSKITSSINQAEANVEYIKTQLDRVRRLHEKGAVSNKTLEELELGLVVAENKLQEALDAKSTAEFQLRQAETQLDLTQTKLADSVMYSPMNGTVVKQLFEQGEATAAGMPTLVIGRLDKLEVEFGVTDELVIDIKKGDKMKVKIYGANIEVDGVVTGIDASADIETRTFGVKIEIDNEDGLIKPGMIANVSIPKGLVKGIMVPIDIIMDDSETSSIFVYNEESKTVEKREVVVGQVFGDKIQIKEGLNEGDRIVINGQYGLLDGEEVNARGVEKDD